jgi:hypothetical protein
LYTSELTEEMKRKEKEDKELYENFSIPEKELGQVLCEYWAYYFLTIPRSDIGEWDKVPHKMKNCWIRTALDLAKTIDKGNKYGVE